MQVTRRLLMYRNLGNGWSGIVRYGLVLPFKAKFVWKSRCRVCGVLRASWRMLPHWQPMHIPNVVGHRGGSLCRPCHRRLCGRGHADGAACARDLMQLPTWNLGGNYDIDAILEEEAGP